MPLTPFWRYTCPITGTTEDSFTSDRPPGWFVLNGELYAPTSMGVMAARVARGVADPAQLVAVLGSVVGDPGYVEPPVVP